MLFGQLICMLAGFIIYISIEYNLGSIALGPVNLNQRSGCRHNDYSLNAEALCCISHALCMVARRCCNQSLSSLLIRKCRYLIISTPQLISTCLLHILRLKINLVTGKSREIITIDQLCLLCYLTYGCTGFFKTIKRKHLLPPSSHQIKH